MVSAAGGDDQGAGPAAHTSASGHRSPSLWALTGSTPAGGPDAAVATGWFLVPLRLFLGATFVFAGLQKLANPQFFSNANPISIHAQLVGASHASPIHALVVHLVPAANAVGAVIAVGEVAIGLGLLVGLWMRLAAAAGMVLSFSLFLTVSFHASPYFTGSDIVFFFAWTPFVLAGAAGAPALDTWLARRRTTLPSASPHAVPRRVVLTRGAWAGVVAGAVLVGGGLAALIGRAAGGTSSVADTTVALGASTPTTTAASPTTTVKGQAPSGTSIGPTSKVPVGGSASFTDPSTGDPSLVIQQTAGDFVAFDAVCPHAGCTVAYQPSAKLIACPCHGSEFNAETGSVIRGPATVGLNRITVAAHPNGDLYVAE